MTPDTPIDRQAVQHFANDYIIDSVIELMIDSEIDLCY